MGNPIQKPLIGHEYLPKVMKEYAETLNGLTQEGCDKLGIPCLACDGLMNALGPGDQGIIYDHRKESLRKAGFSWDFIQGLAGNDGKKALSNRVRWLADHAVTQWWRVDYNLQERKQIINELALYKDESFQRIFLPSLLQAFKEARSPDLQQTTESALRRVSENSYAAIPIWIRALQDENWKVRKLAAEILGDLGPMAEAAVPFLIEHLRKDHSTIQIASAKALGKMGEAAERAVPELAKAVLWKRDPLLRKSSMKALREIGSDEGLDSYELARVLMDPDWTLRLEVAEYLGKVKAVESVPDLTDTLDDEDWRVRSVAASALGEIGPDAKASVPALVKALQDEEWTVRVFAAAALGKMGTASKAAIPALTEASRKGHDSVRKAAMEALKKIGSTR
jgi:HEAT repeat protein